MPSSSKLVNTSEAFELRLVHYLGNHDATCPFVLECETFISKGDAPSLLRAIFEHRPALDVLFDNQHLNQSNSFVNALGNAGFGSSKDGIHAFSLLCSLLDRIPNTDDLKQVMGLIIEKVEGYQFSNEENGDAQNGDKANLTQAIVESKLNMLCALYNLRNDGEEKCWILARILHTCAFGGDDECVLSLLPGRDSTLGTLLEKNNLGNLLAGLEGNQSLHSGYKRELYLSASNASAKVAEVCLEKGMEKEASIANGSKQRFLLKMLSTYSNAEEVDEYALSAAKKAAIGAICDPISLFHEQRCIMSLIPVIALEKDAETKPLFELLSIFQQGKLEDFESFQTNNAETLTKNSISSSSATRHMRLLSLCSLATEHEEIPYDAIATTLKVEASDVESWVIEAVSSGLLSAKMDQLQKVVLVERCVVRRFGIEQWKVLQKRIDVWKKNVKDVLEGLKSSQIGTAAMTNK